MSYGPTWTSVQTCTCCTDVYMLYMLYINMYIFCVEYACLEINTTGQKYVMCQ